jgi:hypothetical protein
MVVLHAFDEPGLEASRPPGWTPRERLLVVLCLPPLLLALWTGSIHHNWHRGLSAVRFATGFGPAAPKPLFLAGSAAGLILVTLVTATGGSATIVEVMSERWIWVFILLPDLAWAGPLAVAWVLMPLRRPILSLTPQGRPGAFEPPAHSTGPEPFARSS